MRRRKNEDDYLNQNKDKKKENAKKFIEPKLVLDKVNDNTALILFLGSLCFFLAAVENSIPKPLPFMRLGLANAPIIFALFLLNTREYFLLVFIKVLGQALISGTLFSYIILFSAGGSFASALAMLFLQRLAKNQVSCLGISLFGSLANTLVQYFLARYILFGSGAVLIAPLLILSGTITGIGLGIFSELFLKRSQWFVSIKEGRKAKIYSRQGQDFQRPKQKKKGFRIKAFLTPLFIFCSIVFFNLFQAYGKVLFTVVGFEVTSGALYSGIKRASILTGMVFVSKLIVSSSFRLPGNWGQRLDQIFYYVAMLTEKTQSDESQKKTEQSRDKKSKWDGFISVLEAIDRRLVEVYF